MSPEYKVGQKNKAEAGQGLTGGDVIEHFECNDAFLVVGELEQSAMIGAQDYVKVAD